MAHDSPQKSPQRPPREPWDRFVGLFSSLRLAVVLLIILAAVSVVGTLIPQERGTTLYLARYGQGVYRCLKLLGVIDLYHSWGFRVLTGLIAVNLFVCSARRVKGVYNRTLRPDAERPGEAIKGLKVNSELPSPEKAHVLEAALAAKRYRIRKRGRFVYGAKGRIGPWGDIITHMSILLVLSGAMVGSLGFVGTANVYVGDYTGRCYNWSAGRETPLGFDLYVEGFALKYYPVDVKVGVRDRATGRKAGEFTTREGESFDIPGAGYTVSVKGFDPDRREAVLNIYKGDALAGVYDTGLPAGGPQAPPLFRYDMALTAYKEPVIKSVDSTVRIIKDGRVVRRGSVEVGSPIDYGGVGIYQSSYGRDPEGRYYSGFQIVKDPGVPLVWAGFSLLLAGLFMSFFFYHRQVWVYVGDDRIVVGGSTNKDWKGFMREYGGLIKGFIQEVEP